MYSTEKLINFGLSEKEAIVYIALLELEVSIVQEITKKTGLNRSSIYVVLDSLQDKGLVNIASSDTVTKYVATSPNQLLRMAKDNVEKYILLKQNLKILLPNLQIIRKESRFKPKVIIYEGKEGLRECFEVTLNAKDDVIRISSSVGLIFSILPNYLPSYVERRMKRGLKMLGIHPNDLAVRNMMKTSAKYFDEPVLIPENKYKFPSDLAIYDNTIGFMTSKDLFAIGIESESMANVVKTLFDLAREEAKRLSETITKKST